MDANEVEASNGHNCRLTNYNSVIFEMRISRHESVFLFRDHFGVTPDAGSTAQHIYEYNKYLTFR